MNTLEKIESMDEQAFVEITALLSRGNVTLQGCGMFTDADFDRLLNKVVRVNLGEN